MKLIVRYIRQIWPAMVLLLFVAIIATFFTTLRPVAAAGVINLVLDQIGYTENVNAEVEEVQAIEPNFFDLNQVGSLITDLFFSYGIEDNIVDSIPYFIFVLIILSLLAGIVKYSASALNSYLRSKIIKRLREDLSQTLLGLDLSFFNSIQSGDLMSRILADAQSVGQGVVSLTHRMTHSFLVIIAYLAFLINTSASLTATIGVIFVAHYIITALLRNPVKKYEISNLSALSSLTSALQEAFSNMRLVKSNPSSDISSKRLNEKISNSSREFFKRELASGLEPEARYLLDGIAEGIVLFVAVIQLFSGTINVEGFLLYIYVARLTLGPVNEFSSHFLWIQKIFASSERINEYFATQSQIKDGDLAINNFDVLDIKDLSFSFEEKKVLQDFNLLIKNNEKIGIVGKSGAGKSTVIDLILRFYDPNRGKITIDNVNIKDFSLKSYRNLFGIVLQDVTLINDTVENNIKYGRNISDERLKESAIIANAHDFIIELSDGYKTIIGDRGAKLSGGQRQRLSIARAIAADPKILVLDEATSSLDSDAEFKVQVAIQNALSNRTAIVIAHRFSTLSKLNKIIVMNNGKVEAIGTNESLYKESSTYKQLYDLQFGRSEQ